MLRARANNTGTILCQAEFVKRVSYAEKFAEKFLESYVNFYKNKFKILH